MNAIIEVIAPVFGIVLLGVVLARLKFFNAHTSDGLSAFMYYVAIPALLFKSLATTTLPEDPPWAYFLAFYGPTIGAFCLGLGLARHVFGWERASQGVCGMSSCYSNMVMLGLPVVAAAYGQAATLPLFTLMAVQSSILFPLGTYTIEVYGGRTVGGQTNVVKAIGKLLVNPVIASLVLGVVVNLAHVTLPATLSSILGSIAAAAPACALVSLGVSLAQYELTGGLGEAVAMTIVKNVLHPLGVWGACLLLRIPADWTKVAVLVAAMPSGVNGYIFAKRYSLREAEISKTIVVSTIATAFVAAFIVHVMR
ncbi:MAG: AEC family transporter [Gammaproteobacteria bacterium]|nr:AEC family transporter [Gammaproteobacteria bacterium]MBI5615700.1 AEC family transporter [Gammaproteobacteria bacterium]